MMPFSSNPAAVIGLGLGLLIGFDVTFAQGTRPPPPPPPANAAAATEPDGKYVQTLIAGIERNSRDTFVSLGDVFFKARVTKEVLDQTHRVLSPRLRAGYKLRFIGATRKEGNLGYLYSLEFRDKPDDVLVLVVLKDDLVNGFSLF
jgi:hypothetical protein